MKLDKIKFARLIGMITSLASRTLDSEEIEAIDYVCEVEVPAVSTNINPEQLHVLMALMQEGTRKIEAIKQHRIMTGYGLKESKDAVEKYWPISPPAASWTKEELMNRINSNPPTADYAALKSFINNL